MELSLEKDTSVPKTRIRVLRVVTTALFVLILLLGAIGSVSAQQTKRVIIDTDPGTDDALAILLGLNSPELRVEALTIVAGNVTAPSLNNSRI